MLLSLYVYFIFWLISKVLCFLKDFKDIFSFGFPDSYPFILCVFFDFAFFPTGLMAEISLIHRNDFLYNIENFKTTGLLEVTLDLFFIMKWTQDC